VIESQRPPAPNRGTMTSEQCRIVRRTLEPLRELARPTSLLFYGRLFELDPAARRLFHNDLVVQSRKLMDTLTTVVDSLDQFESVRPRLIQLGRLHASYGVRLEQYDTVVAALLWAIGQALGPDFDSDTREAWALALGAIAATMKEGANAL
jgi:hemoglobin-like flavoprotein